MLSGLYRVHFQTPLGSGAGVIYANNGHLWGGDSGIYYRGTYQEDGANLTASVQIDRHTNMAGLVSVFGIDRATINLSGTNSGGAVMCNGTSPQAAGVTFSAHLQHIAD